MLCVLEILCLKLFPYFKFKASICKKKNCNDTCGRLHVCENEIKRNGCRRGFCRFEHELRTPHNIDVLQVGEFAENLDFVLLKRIFQVSASNGFSI